MDSRKMYIVGFITTIIGYVFAFIETAYFGFNWTPINRAEFICDCIASMIIRGGLSMLIGAIISNTANEIEELRKSFED